MAEERKYIARMQIVGGAEARAEVDATTKAVESGTTKMQSAFEKVGSKADGLDAGFKKLNRGVNDARGAIELLGGAVPGLDNVFGALSRNIGNVSDVFGTLSGLFLKNPIGIAATAVSAVAAAFVLFNKAADAATTSVDGSGKAASAAAIEFAKLVDPLKTVSGLLDEVRKKQIDAVGGPRAAVGIVLEQQRAAVRAKLGEIEDLGRTIEAGNRRASDNPTFSRTDFEARKAAEDAAKAERLLKPKREELATLQKRLAELEAEEARLRRFEADRIGGGPGDQPDSLPGIRADLKAERERNAQLGSQAAAEQARQLDALVGKYAPAIKAENELTAAREAAIRLAEAGALTGERYEAVLRGIADAEFAATEEGRAAADMRAFAQRVTEETTTAEERYAEAIKKTDEALAAGAISEEQATRKRALETQRLERATQSETKSGADLARDLGLTFTSAFENAVGGGRKLRDVLRGLGEDLLKLSVRKSLTEPLLELAKGVVGGGSKTATSGGGGIFGGIFDGIGSFLGGLFANGAAFDRGNVTAFASGGSVVDRPTLFPMSRGRTGLMGEAGPEAILPLARGRDGRLGVAANQSQGRTVVVNIDARGSAHGEAQRIRHIVMTELAPMITDGAVLKVEQRANLGGSFSRAVGRRGRG